MLIFDCDGGQWCSIVYNSMTVVPGANHKLYISVCGYFCQYIQYFAKVSTPLTCLEIFHYNF